jgi:riboflavin biosynthesis pyrimidine reductase
MTGPDRPSAASPPELVDRLWPDPAPEVSLDDAMADFSLPPAPSGRPLVAINMVTSIDGRAQLNGTADGLASRTDRHLMRRYRAAFDAVATGAGTLRVTGLGLRVGRDMAARRADAGRAPNPTAVILAGATPVPATGRWVEGDEARILVVGVTNPMSDAPPGTELLRAPDERPSPRWVLERLAERGIGSVLLEGGPHLNAAFLAEDLIDEVYWTIGAHLLGTDALPMIAAIAGGSPFAHEPRRGSLVSVLRHEDELFLRYRFDARS